MTIANDEIVSGGSSTGLEIDVAVMCPMCLEAELEISTSRKEGKVHIYCNNCDYSDSAVVPYKEGFSVNKGGWK